MHTTEPAIEERAAEPELSFFWLHDNVAAYLARSRYSKPSRAERASLWIALGAAGLGLLAAALSPSLIAPEPAAITLSICLGVELAGFAVHLILLAIRELPQLLKLRLTHAVDMDFNFDSWRQLVGRLRQFPRAECEEMLRFSSGLRQRMNERLGLLFGGIQRLGVFPVLVALYLQFRNWTWGNWAAAFDVNPVAGLIIWMMVLLYALGWLLIGLRTRLDSYIELLEAALQRE